MTDDQPPSKIQPFPNEASRQAVRDLLQRVVHPEQPAPLPNQRVKLGLYPLAEDVIISLPLYQLILTVLDGGVRADQLKVAEMMRQAFAAPFPP